MAVADHVGVVPIRNRIGDVLIDGAGEQVLVDLNPADINQVMGRGRAATADQVQAAIGAAVEAASPWAETPGVTRAEILKDAGRRLRALADELAQLQSREMGKPITESRGEAAAAVDHIEYYAAAAQRLSGETLQSVRQGVQLATSRRPLGVVALITPWNFPVSIPSKKLAAALAAGNSVVLKPASNAPLLADSIVTAFVDAGVPRGVINVVVGPGDDIGDAIVTSPPVAGVSFTGSTEVGQRIIGRAASRGAAVQAEMGGKNAAVILPDCELDRAISLVVDGAFRSAGQKCTATSRVIVDEQIYDEFVRRLEAAMASVKLGEPLDPQTFLGPVVDERQMNKVLGFIKVAQEEGADLLCGGSRATTGALSRGYFVEPTVFTNVTSEMTLAHEEVFGPVLAVMKASGLEEAIRITNATRYGLAAAIHTQSLRAAREFAERAEVGCVGVNVTTAGWETQAPFGGLKASGYGIPEQGSPALSFYTHNKTLALQA